jgi:hypothetical protein
MVTALVLVAGMAKALGLDAMDQTDHLQKQAGWFLQETSMGRE